MAAAARFEGLEAIILWDLEQTVAIYRNTRAHRSELDVVLTALRAQKERVEA